MKKLSFHYNMKLVFDSPVSDHHFSLKCIPQSDEMQHIQIDTASVFPKEFLSDGRDSFGNFYLFGLSSAPHLSFEAQISGRAVTGLSDSIPLAQGAASGLYRFPTAYTAPGPSVRAFYREIAPSPAAGSGEDAFLTARILMRKLHEHFPYQSGITGVHTTAEEAMQLGAGVCQDYAHILISLCQLAGIPARYAAGLLIGEGASHAWTEIAVNGRWYGLDPTGAVPVTDSHIKLAVGRNSSDCQLNRGIFRGSAGQTQSVTAAVKEINETCEE